MEATARVERAVGVLPLFRGTRPDERVQIASRFERIELQPGQSLHLAKDAPKLILVLSGELSLSKERTDPLTVFVGDSLGEAAVLAREGGGEVLTAREPSTLATLDCAAVDKILNDYPVVALALVSDLARELKWRNDVLREALVARAEGLSDAQLTGILRGRRRMLQRYRQGATRRISGLLWRVVVTEPSRRPAFWMFLGAALALISARTVVAYILKRGLQNQLFALIGGGGEYHPIHVHHFNYGLVLVSTVGVLSMTPGVRRALRFLCFVFGFGMGLVVDEFALLWNLNPDYYQPSSRVVAALVLFVLGQIVYFRRVYEIVARRIWVRVFG